MNMPCRLGLEDKYIMKGMHKGTSEREDFMPDTC